MSQNILVTGGAGYLGSTMVPDLLAAGHKVTVLDNFMYGQNSLAHVCHNPNFNVVRGDVRQEATVLPLLKKADASAAVMSRILNGVAYPDMTTIAKLEAYTGADLWGTHYERMQLLDGNYNPSRRQYRS